MARPQSVNDEELLGRLAAVFRARGFSGASLAELSAASGLKRASLYHRFPGGKEQMAREVLAAAADWLEREVIAPLTGDAPPAARLEAVGSALDGFYDGGAQACLLNMLSSARVEDGPFSAEIGAMFARLIDALARLGEDAGLGADVARERAERAVMLIQGALVLARGCGDRAPFRRMLGALPETLLGPAAAAGAEPLAPGRAGP